MQEDWEAAAGVAIVIGAIPSMAVRMNPVAIRPGLMGISVPLLLWVDWIW